MNWWIGLEVAEQVWLAESF